jgi:hypothetical protein
MVRAGRWRRPCFSGVILGGGRDEWGDADGMKDCGEMWGRECGVGDGWEWLHSDVLIQRGGLVHNLGGEF